MITIYGRADSSAVARVMWTVGELDLPHRRLDWGGAFGGNDDAAYRQLNPAGRIPAVVFPDGATLWESNAIIRCLAALHGPDGLIPSEPVARAQVEAWMEYSGSVAGAVSAVRAAYKSSEPDRSILASAVARAGRTLAVLNERLGASTYLGGDRFGVGDLAHGVWVHRWFRCPAELPDLPQLPHLQSWYARLSDRSAFQAHVVTQVSAGPQRIGGDGAA